MTKKQIILYGAAALFAVSGMRDNSIYRPQ